MHAACLYTCLMHVCTHTCTHVCTHIYTYAIPACHVQLALRISQLQKAQAFVPPVAAVRVPQTLDEAVDIIHELTTELEVAPLHLLPIIPHTTRSTWAMDSTCICAGEPPR